VAGVRDKNRYRSSCDECGEERGWNGTPVNGPPVLLGGREEREEKENKRNTCMLASARWMIPFGFIDYRR
jgi:hypothetical protein